MKNVRMETNMHVKEKSCQKTVSYIEGQSITASTCKRCQKKGETSNAHFVDRLNSLGQW